MNHTIKPILRGLAAAAALAAATLAYAPRAAQAQQSAPSSTYMVLNDFQNLGNDPVGLTFGSDGSLWSPLNTYYGDYSDTINYTGDIAKFDTSGANHFVRVSKYLRTIRQRAALSGSRRRSVRRFRRSDFQNKSGRRVHAARYDQWLA